MKRKIWLFVPVFISALLLASCSLSQPGGVSSSPSGAGASVSDATAGGDALSSETVTEDGVGSPTLEKGAHSVFTGKLNGHDILIDIYRSGSKLTAAYVEQASSAETALHGTIDGSSLSLASDKGTLTGTVTDSDSITAFYTPNNGTASPVTFQMDHVVLSASAEKRYPDYNAAEVETLTAAIQKAVSSDDAKALSKLVAYPMQINCNGWVLDIETPDAFVANYDSIMNAGFKAALTTAYPKFMFSNWKGVMFGSGAKNLWINREPNGTALKIVAFNN